MSTSLAPEAIFAARPIPPPEVKGASSDGPAPLILLVDDSPQDLAFYAAHLIASGFRVETATTGGDAVALALSLVPDLIVMDLEMPGIDGWEATRLLGGHEHTVRIPVIALSGFHGTAIVMRAICAGCSGFVPKPCLAEELQAAIRSTLERARGQK
jgi:two-component system cell cycle response regulator DivK